MDKEERIVSSWVKVFWFTLITIAAIVAGLWIVFGTFTALFASVKLFLLHIPACIILSFYAGVVYTLYDVDFEFDDWHFLWF